MKLLISFGQIHVHSIGGTTFDKDCLALIEGEDYEDCRKKATEEFKGIFATDYPIEKQDDPNFMKFFPRGVIKL